MVDGGYKITNNSVIQTILHMIARVSFVLPRISFEGRLIEYQFAHSNIISDEKKIILDVGSADTKFPIELANKKHIVYSLDITQRLVNPKITYIVGTLEDLPFEDNFFDIVTAISTIEHVGLGRYGDAISPNGDIVAIDEIYRVLKPGGKVIFTIPAGIDLICYSKSKIPLHRVYSPRRIYELLSRFKILELSYVIKKRGVWHSGSASDAVNIAVHTDKEKIGMTTIALIVGIKE
jgi:SAM-dependent methyltransferase